MGAGGCLEEGAVEVGLALLEEQTYVPVLVVCVVYGWVGGGVWFLRVGSEEKFCRLVREFGRVCER